MMRIRNGLSLLFCLSLSGCGMFSFFSSDMDLDEVKIRTRADANDNAATAIDVVLVMKKQCESYVAPLTAKDWFNKKDQIRRDHPDCLTVKSWELVPDQHVKADIDEDPAAAYVFAYYTSPGDHRIRIADTFDTIHIILKKTDFVIREQESTP